MSCRLMATCLPLVWTLTQQTERSAVFKQLDQVVLCTLLSNMSERLHRKYGCSDHDTCEGELHSIILPRSSAAGPCCESCKAKHEIEWRKAAEQLELALAEAGWGCS